VFSFVPTKTNVEERCAERVKKYSKNRTKIEELSILFLGVDSVSIIFIERNIFHVFCPRKFFDEFSGCHGNYVNKSIICYFIIANKQPKTYLISGILDISVFMRDRRQILCWII
jgi:hypothetical protein